MMDKKLLLLMLIVAFLVFPTMTTTTAKGTDYKPTRTPFLFSYNSYIDIDYEPYNEPLPIDQSINIPLTVRYWVDVPGALLHSPFFRLKNWFLFGTLIAPMQKIHLSVLNEPEWCTAYISNPNLLVDIDNEVKEVTTSLIISVNSEAPASPFILNIKAEVPDLKRIKGFKHQVNLDFTPEWISSLIITLNQTTVLTPPNLTTNVSINITNKGNTWTIVTSEVINELEGWSNSITPFQIYIPVDETEQVILSLMPPEDFQGNQSIHLGFTPSHHNETGDTRHILITAYYP